MSQTQPTLFPPQNPYRPGAGHRPPYLAGRERQKQAFLGMLTPPPIMKNLILTGLRGVGKTVLLEDLRDIAVEQKWAWVSNEMSDSACVTEDHMATRILADLSKATSALTISNSSKIGFAPDADIVDLDYSGLRNIFEDAPGLVADRLLYTMRIAIKAIQASGVNGIVFAYDEAQSLSDKADMDHYPTAVLLDVFQRLQRENLPVLLVLTGLPTLQARLAESRTYSERMFSTEIIGKLGERESREAILKPLGSGNEIFTESDIKIIIAHSGGYPYFIQFICKDTFDIILQRENSKQPRTPIHIEDILLRLDTDFYASRWALATDAQKRLLKLIASIDKCEKGFSIKQIQSASTKQGERKLDDTTVSKTLKGLCDAGIVYKEGYGRYTFGVPMFEAFIRRMASADAPGASLRKRG